MLMFEPVASHHRRAVTRMLLPSRCNVQQEGKQPRLSIVHVIQQYDRSRWLTTSLLLCPANSTTVQRLQYCCVPYYSTVVAALCCTVVEALLLYPLRVTSTAAVCCVYFLFGARNHHRQGRIHCCNHHATLLASPQGKRVSSFVAQQSALVTLLYFSFQVLPYKQLLVPPVPWFRWGDSFSFHE